MKFLRSFLAFIYVALIILLLLRCCGGCQRAETPAPDTPEPAPGDRPPVEIKESFKADVVMCIDITASMGAIINTIKENALNFYPDLKARCLREGKEIKSMRISVIGFRDYEMPNPLDILNGYDTPPTPPFQQSGFFTMPTQENDFRTFVSNLQPIGGGDDPEAGYDALAIAFKSDWDRSDDVRQIVILWTDNPSHPTGRNATVVGSFEELTQLWYKMSRKNKRLFLFAPNEPTWETLVAKWDHTVRHDVSLGGGLTDVDYEDILRTLSESM
ncbi:MAG: VWA domain-containing protein [Alloprevotella sp.]|nr:VWA domain-containing protein [Alloprevotella sp.]